MSMAACRLSFSQFRSCRPVGTRINSTILLFGGSLSRPPGTALSIVFSPATRGRRSAAPRALSDSAEPAKAAEVIKNSRRCIVRSPSKAMYPEVFTLWKGDSLGGPTTDRLPLSAPAEVLRPIGAVIALRREREADSNLRRCREHDVSAVTGRSHPAVHHRAGVSIAGGDVLRGGEAVGPRVGHPSPWAAPILVLVREIVLVCHVHAMASSRLTQRGVHR